MDFLNSNQPSMQRLLMGFMKLSDDFIRGALSLNSRYCAYPILQ